jgi:hypothetical protein
MAVETKDAGSAAPLEGSAALDLYLAELSSSVAAIAEQPTLLLQATLAERPELVQELQRAAIPAVGDTSEKA